MKTETVNGQFKSAIVDVDVDVDGVHVDYSHT